MTQLYTERNLLRAKVEKTWHVSLSVYGLLLDVCRKYLVNLSEQFPLQCPDGDDVYGVDERRLFKLLKLRVPGLLRDEFSDTDAPKTPWAEVYDQFSLFDYIEYIAQNMVTVIKGRAHDFFHHHHLIFRHDDTAFHCFAREVNDIFTMSGLQYVLTEERQIERITDADDFVRQAEGDAKLIPEKGLKDLIAEAIALYHNARPETHHLATEKIWDAFERIKTFYVELDKRHSAEKLVNGIANEKAEFVKLFSNEFKTLTEIGNDFRIRHHETNKVDIEDDCYCDYLFVRCLALIDLAVKTVIGYE